MAFLHEIKPFFFVSLGAIVGSNVRFLMYQRLEKISRNKHFRIFIINNLASFLLGFSYSIFINISSMKYSYELSLIFVIGFLGSMSTFSTFIYDLFEISYDSKYIRLVIIFLLSISFSLISLSIGYLLGN